MSDERRKLFEKAIDDSQPPSSVDEYIAQDQSQHQRDESILPNELDNLLK